jgi:hypothetical protein
MMAQVTRPSRIEIIRCDNRKYFLAATPTKSTHFVFEEAAILTMDKSAVTKAELRIFYDAWLSASALEILSSGT